MASEGCLKFTVLTLLMFAMAALLVAMLTDYWYTVEKGGILAKHEKQKSNFRFGFWRMCFDERPEDSFLEPDVQKSGENCIWIYKNLLPKHEDHLSSNHRVRLNLMRASLGLSIAASAFLLSAILSLLCAWVPGNCQPLRKSKVYIAAILVVVVALMAAIASGICFMAARDVEKRDLAMYPNTQAKYHWSFMLHWAGTGLILVTGSLMLYMLSNATTDFGGKQSHYYYSY